MPQKQFMRAVVGCALVALAALCHHSVAEARAQEGAAKKSAAARRGAARPQTPRRPQTRTGPEEERARELVEEGRRLSDEGKWEEAVKAFNRALAASPRHPEALLGLGDALMNSGKYVEGFDAYRRAVEAAPWNADAHYSLGAAYNDMAQYGDSFKHFVQAIRLDPDFAEAHYGIGYAYLNLDNFKDALPYLRQAVRLKPDYAEARLALGKTHLGLRDMKSAEVELKALVGLDATAARALEREVRAAAGVAATNPPARLVDTLVYAKRPEPSRAETAAPKVAGGTTTTTEGARPVQTAAQAPAAKPTPAARQKGAAANSASLLAVELSFWESIKDGRDPEEFAAYLRKYPEGQFAELARIRLRALEGRKEEAANAAAGARQEAAAAVAPVQQAPSSPAAPDAAVVTAQPSQATTRQPTPETAAQASPPPPPPPAESPAAAQPAGANERPAEERPTPDRTTEAAAPATVEAALGQLRTLLASRFSYKVTNAGGEAGGGGGAPSASEVNVSYEPLKFEGCTVEWRDRNDALWVTLSDLDPEAVRVAPRTRPGQTFSMEVWDVSISALGGRGAFSEAKGDGSGTVNRYNGLDLQYDAREKAERLAAVLRQTIRLCAATTP